MIDIILRTYYFVIIILIITFAFIANNNKVRKCELLCYIYCSRSVLSYKYKNELKLNLKVSNFRCVSIHKHMSRSVEMKKPYRIFKVKPVFLISPYAKTVKILTKAFKNFRLFCRNNVPNDLRVFCPQISKYFQTQGRIFLYTVQISQIYAKQIEILK